MKNKVLIPVILMVAWSSLQLVSAQANPQEPQKEPQKVLLESLEITMQVDYIQLSFLVRDSEGNLIRNLEPQDFILVENGQEKTIAVLKEQSLPLNAVIAVDTSYSIGSFLNDSLHTAMDFFRGLQGESSAFVLFSEAPRVILDWDQELIDPSVYLQDVKLDGKTALYDSILWIGQNMFRDRTGKKLIIFLSDCIDTKSKSSFEDMVMGLRKEGVSLYPIIYTNRVIESQRRKLDPAPRGKRRGSVSSYFQAFLAHQNEFLDQSMRHGGRTIFSEGFVDLKRIYKDIIDEMKARYVLLYQSSGDLAEAQRDVNVYTRRVSGKIYIDMSR